MVFNVNQRFYLFIFFICFSQLIQPNEGIGCECNATHCQPKKIKRINGVMVLGLKREIIVIDGDYLLYSFDTKTYRLNPLERTSNVTKTMKARISSFVFTDSESYYYSTFFQPPFLINYEDYDMKTGKIIFEKDESLQDFDTFESGKSELFSVAIFYPNRHINAAPEQYSQYYFAKDDSVWLHKSGYSYKTDEGNVIVHPPGSYPGEGGGKKYLKSTNASDLYPYYIIPLPGDITFGFIFYSDANYVIQNIDDALILRYRPIGVRNSISVGGKKVKKILALIFRNPTNRDFIIIDDNLRNISVTLTGKEKKDMKLNFKLNERKNNDFIESFQKRDTFSVVASNENEYYSWEKSPKLYRPEEPITLMARVIVNYGTLSYDIDLIHTLWEFREFYSFISLNTLTLNEDIFIARAAYIPLFERYVRTPSKDKITQRAILFKPKINKVYTKKEYYYPEPSKKKTYIIKYQDVMKRKHLHPLITIRLLNDSSRDSKGEENREHIAFYNHDTGAKYVVEKYAKIVDLPFEYPSFKNFSSLFTVCDKDKKIVTTEEPIEEFTFEVIPSFNEPDQSGDGQATDSSGTYSILSANYSVLPLLIFLSLAIILVNNLLYY